MQSKIHVHTLNEPNICTCPCHHNSRHEDFRCLCPCHHCPHPHRPLNGGAPGGFQPGSHSSSFRQAPLSPVQQSPSPPTPTHSGDGAEIIGTAVAGLAAVAVIGVVGLILLPFLFSSKS